MAFYDVRDVDTQGKRASVDEREVQVSGAGFAGKILLPRGLGLRSHLICGQSLDLPEFLDSRGHFLDLVVQSRYLSR